jgi:outer membrane protein TolC
MELLPYSKKRIATQLKAARSFVAVGMVPHLNVLRNEVEMSRVDQQEICVVNTLRTAELLLNKLLGNSSRALIDYERF